MTSEFYSWLRVISFPVIAVALAWAVFRVDWWFRHRSSVDKPNHPIEHDSNDPI